MTEEAQLQKLVLEFLKATNLVHWRQGLGGLRTGSGARRANPMKGFPDICGIDQHGKFWGIELKAAKGIVSEDQKKWHTTLRQSGATIAVCRDFQSAVHFINQIRG